MLATPNLAGLLSSLARSDAPPKITLHQFDVDRWRSAGGAGRDELLNGEIFYSLKEAQIVIEQWHKSTCVAISEFDLFRAVLLRKKVLPHPATHRRRSNRFVVQIGPKAVGRIK
jgi:hypothetical protein